MRLLPSCLDPCLPRAWRSEKKTVMQYRMDELAKAFAAAHLAFDVLEDEHEIAKLKKAEKLAKEVHAKAHPEGTFFRNLMRADSDTPTDPTGAGAST